MQLFKCQLYLSRPRSLAPTRLLKITTVSVPLVRLPFRWKAHELHKKLWDLTVGAIQPCYWRPCVRRLGKGRLCYGHVQGTYAGFTGRLVRAAAAGSM